ncbi:hypothetical protein ACWDFL_37810 [Streptomyces bungoensis]
MVIAQPERPFFGGWKVFLAGPGPLLVLSTAEDAPLGAVKPITKVRRSLFRDDYALVDPAGSLLLRIEVDDVLPSLGKVQFRGSCRPGDGQHHGVLDRTAALRGGNRAPELGPQERRGVVASAVCLHLLRRVLAGGTSPA